MPKERRISIIEVLTRTREKEVRMISEILSDKKSTRETNHRRDRHEIIAEILKTAKDGKKKTYIMYEARLSHSQLKLYLKFLNQSGMITSENGVYRTTSKGLSFVKELESVNFLFHQ